jgi:hypothetical protein
MVMSCETIYTFEETDEGVWSVMNETSITGHIVLGNLGKESSEFYADLMNEVYNQVKKDVKEGWIK